LPPLHATGLGPPYTQRDRSPPPTDPCSPSRPLSATDATQTLQIDPARESSSGLSAGFVQSAVVQEAASSQPHMTSQSSELAAVVERLSVGREIRPEVETVEDVDMEVSPGGSAPGPQIAATPAGPAAPSAASKVSDAPLPPPPASSSLPLAVLSALLPMAESAIVPAPSPPSFPPPPSSSRLSAPPGVTAKPVAAPRSKPGASDHGVVVVSGPGASDISSLEGRSNRRRRDDKPHSVPGDSEPSPVQ
ncbi:hypothetical protein FRC07_001664, partial [Ceratobasidium sp. 392]